VGLPAVAVAGICCAARTVKEERAAKGARHTTTAASIQSMLARRVVTKHE
jgi:hypothetical protein